MASSRLPAFPYGAVYFRKSNPPREDWERDYRTAAEDGYNIFRHWFLWSAIEVRPGVYDFADYDRQFELAEKNGIRTIVAEMITAAPEWLYHLRPEGRCVRGDGRPFGPQMGVSSATGGFYGMSLDDDVVRDAAGRFLTELAGRYRDHPALAGYDVWNECNYRDDAGYAAATVAAFRRWLRKRYGELSALAAAWSRHSLADWDQVAPPERIDCFADSLDWLEFLQDNAFGQLRWRVDTIRAIDPINPITAHGVAGSIVSAANRGSDDWRAAAEVDLYGFTWVASRQGDKPYQHLHAVDLTRAASRGKTFWHAEAQGGPLWLQPQVVGRPLEDGRVTKPEDIRIWNMTSFAGGARGLLYPRWRPLLDGPLFGAFGPYAMDGSRTDRSEMTAAIAKWANAAPQQVLWKSAPVRGEIGLLFVPETQILDFALQGSMATYTAAIRGAYQGFFENNIQADFVHIDDIEGWTALYLPYPIMMKRRSAERLAAWARAGGRLISEGLPAYFGDRGRIGPVQPNHGLDELFGAREADVVFAPDLLADLAIEVAGHRIAAGVFLQAYAPTTGSAVGWYDDGRVAAVEHAPGAGHTLLIGSFPGFGFGRHRSEGSCAFFRSLADWAGVVARVAVSNRSLKARLHDGEGGRSLWVLNHSRTAQSATVTLSPNAGPVTKATVLWGPRDGASLDRGRLNVTVGGRDALVLHLG